MRRGQGRREEARMGEGGLGGEGEIRREGRLELGGMERREWKQC